MLNIGERITQLRKQHNISQEELANRAQVSRTIIGNSERNANTPSIEVLIKLARVFDVSDDYMIGEGKLSDLDKDLLKRVEDIEKLDVVTTQPSFQMNLQSTSASSLMLNLHLQKGHDDLKSGY